MMSNTNDKTAGEHRSLDELVGGEIPTWQKDILKRFESKGERLIINWPSRIGRKIFFEALAKRLNREAPNASPL